MRTWLLVLVACGSSHARPDAPPPDTTGDAGRCGGDAFFTGELVDFDSTDAQFCGVFGATLTVAGDSARTFTVARAPDFAYRASAAQVLVHVDGTPRAVSLDVAHDPAQAFTTAWAAGDAGANVFFPNVDPAAGATTIAVTGDSLGAGSVPVAAGTFTYVTVIAN